MNISVKPSLVEMIYWKIKGSETWRWKQKGDGWYLNRIVENNSLGTLSSSSRCGKVIFDLDNCSYILKNLKKHDEIKRLIFGFNMQNPVCLWFNFNICALFPGRWSLSEGFQSCVNYGWGGGGGCHLRFRCKMPLNTNSMLTCFRIELQTNC